MHTALLWCTLAFAGVVDADGDGFSAEEDCDDDEETVYPGAPEIPADGIDQDCDRTDSCYADEDGDGFGASPLRGPIPLVRDTDRDCGNDSAPTSDIPFDCDDTDPTVHAGATEVVADGIDQDCNGEDLCFVDGDRDGFGGTETASAEACDLEGVSDVDMDCDDGEATVYPNAPELCDGHDNDCDGAFDEDATDGATVWFRDADGDGWGDPLATAEACGPHLDFIAQDGDCDDSDPRVSPDGFEVCDGIDNDCDGEVDGASASVERWYADVDGDGYGDPDTFVDGCRPAEGSWVPSGQAWDCQLDNAKSGPCRQCGCAAAGGSWWLWGLLVLGIRTSGRHPSWRGPRRRPPKPTRPR